MKYFLLFVLVFSLVCNISRGYAEELSPPTLNSILKENKKKMRISRFKKDAKIIQSKPFIQKEIPENTGSTVQEFHIVKQGNAITLSSNQSGDLWVQEIDLTKGASIHSVGEFYGFDETTGEPLFKKESLKNHIANIRNKPFSVINGQFFDPTRANTPLSFGIKINNTIQTAGADIGRLQKNIFVLSGQTAQVLPYSWENFRDIPADLALVNLTVGAMGDSESVIGRTYICIPFPDENIKNSKILIWTARALSEKELENQMIYKGCTKKSISRLDSGGSTQLWIDNMVVYGYTRSGVPDYRRIPNVIAFYDSNS